MAEPTCHEASHPLERSPGIVRPGCRVGKISGAGAGCSRSATAMLQFASTAPCPRARTGRKPSAGRLLTSLPGWRINCRELIRPQPSERHDRHARVCRFRRQDPASCLPAVPITVRRRPCVVPKQFTTHSRIPRMTLPRHRDWFGVVLVAFGLLALVGPARAQDAVIRGRVINDRGDALPVATVQIPELNLGVFTTNDGTYAIQIPAARISGQTVTLRVRTIGHKPGLRQITLRAGEQTEDFTLATDVNLLEAVVVTGVQEATEQVKVPFNVTRLDASKLPVSAADPLTQLQGKISANIVSSSGRPGAQPAVLLRGPTSINASGRGQDPLYIVDGVIINGSLPDLNPSDIESVEVVKGAAGASLYGARAGNGVINITTKSARRSLEGVKFDIRSEAGVSDIERDFGLARYHALATDETGMLFCEAVTGLPFCARAFDYATEQARINNAPGDFALNPKGFPIDPGSTISGQPLRQRFQVQPWPGTSYNAVNQLVTPKPFLENTLDMSGRFGTATRFYASASNRREESAIRFLNGFTRDAFRLNVDQTIGTDWNLAFHTAYTRSTQDGVNQEEGC